MDIIGIYLDLFDQNMRMAFVKARCTIGIDFLGWNAVKCGKVAICFKPFGFLFIQTETQNETIARRGLVASQQGTRPLILLPLMGL